MLPTLKSLVGFLKHLENPGILNLVKHFSRGLVVSYPHSVSLLRDPGLITALEL